MTINPAEAKAKAEPWFVPPLIVPVVMTAMIVIYAIMRTH